MRGLHRMVRVALLLAPTLLAVGCADLGDGPGYGSGCTDWSQCVAWQCDWDLDYCWCEQYASSCSGDDGGYTSYSYDAGSTTSANGGGSSGVSGSSGGASASNVGPATSGAAGGDAGASPQGVGTDSAAANAASAMNGSHGDAGAAMGSTNAGDAVAANTCAVSATCPVGTSCAMGMCQPCNGGVCVCQRDDDCAGKQICDHTHGTCTNAPPTCTMLTTEAECAARADCTPVYGGMSCTNSMGSPCHSGEANCTCATYSFAACVARSP
jgi:hypothetical protein